ncbi:4a-hydroxytetrahydrobiopterin dehydratase [uncultured Deefgea sp.]|uniref:4a-hydroxytetrahydrobiopterin dehydratase n=1 Tax=uncultured Deefgea sp. TaxID=1304914 RepID=UPI00261AFB5A|nr:4a-hydroxytetrahydrobiopterin dehydratase [uncultured Deefgea sp.]
MSLITESCNQAAPKLDTLAVEMLCTELDDWFVVNDGLEKTFRFRSFYETIAFTNAVAFIAHQHNHHPDIQLSFSRCKLTWNTHSANGLTRNDFICAACVDALPKAS